MTKLFHGRGQDSAQREGVPLYDCSGKEAAIIIVSRDWDLLVCQRVDVSVLALFLVNFYQF